MLHVFFDLDGTLVDSGEGIIKSVQKALSVHGIKEEDTVKLKSFIGPPLYESFKNLYGFDDEKYAIALEEFHRYYRSIGIFEATLYEGIDTMLSELYDKGIKIYLATSKPETEAIRILEHFKIDKYFTFAAGALGDYSTERSSKTSVIKYVLDNVSISIEDRIYMVGDRKFDILGAKNNALYSIGILYGYGDYEELKNAGADKILETVKDLKRFLLDNIT